MVFVWVMLNSARRLDIQESGLWFESQLNPRLLLTDSKLWEAGKDT